MCGRTSLFISQSDLEDRFNAPIVTDGGYRPRFNIAPGEPLEIIPNESPDTIEQYTWGLVPHWADEGTEGYINARSGTAHEKPSFQDAWNKRPCLVLSSGFYEWQRPNDRPKQPYRIYREDDVAFAMAGLWDEWHSDDGEHRRTVTILTTDANNVMAPIHDRMPVVLPKDTERTWLAAGPEKRRELCRRSSDDDVAAYPISTFVNDPSHDDARIIESLKSEQANLGEFRGA